MKLLVSWMRELSTYVSREFYYIMQDLIRVHGWRQIEPPVLARDPQSAKATLLEVLGGMPQAILFWETYDLYNAIHATLRDLGCRTCMFADDLHMLWGFEHQRAAKLLSLSQCDVVLTPYAYVFDDFYPELRGRKNVVWAPHSASPDFLLPFNDWPENAILLSGAIGSPYPLRCRMRVLQEEGRHAIAWRKHPGYLKPHDYESDSSVGVGYARTIHRYKVGFTDALTFRYIVAKYFEIPATGSLLLADDAVREPLMQLGFIENQHYVPASGDNLEDQVKYVLDQCHDEEFAAIRRRGQELVMSRHKTSDRAETIDRACTQ